MRQAAVALEIKALDEDARRIEGWATKPEEDRVGDIVLPKGAIYKLPLPFLLDHDAKQAVGEVDRVEVTDKGIKFWAHIKKIPEPGEVKDLCDKAWSLVRNGLRKAVSIGFAAKEFDVLPTGGLKFTSWEWLELSAVTVPAAPGAVITGVKSYSSGEKIETVSAPATRFDTGAPAATGQDGARADATPPGASGKSTKPVHLRPKEATKMKTLAEQISAFESKRAANSARMNEIQSKAAEEGRTKDASEKEEFQTLADEIDTIDDELKDLRRMEKANALAAKPVNRVEKSDDGAAARSGIVLKTPQKLAPGIAFARIARVKALSKLDVVPAQEIARKHYGEDSAVYGFFTKAAVAPATTSDATWAGALVGDETSAFADFVEFLRPMTILGKFGTGVVPSLRRVPFRTPLIGQTSGGSGYWVGEGQAKPLTKFDFARTTLEPLKVANIAVATMEVVRDSSPSAETIIRDQLAAALRERLDIDFINPAKAASAGVSPASILNGVTAVASSGTTADDVRTDLRALFQKFIDANNAPTSGVWIMQSTTALALSLMQNPLGQSEFPGVGMNGGTLLGLPVIVSEYVPDGVVALVNAGDIYIADDGDVTVDMSREASLQMDNAPANPSDATTVMVSLWQRNLVGFLAERTVNWAKRRPEAAQLLTGVAWGDA